MFENKIAVIIITFNGEKWLDKCIKPLYEVDNIKIVVIDNASTDKTTDIIKKNYPDVELIISDKNLGFGQANNRGFEYAIKEKFKYVLLLNQDAQIDQHNLKILIEDFSVINDVGIMSPIHFKNEDEIENLFSFYLKDNNIDQIAEKFYKMKFINAAIWLTTTDILKKIGGFNPVFFHYGEDVEFVNRLKYFNYMVYLNSTTKGFHFRNYDKKEIRDNSSKKRHFGPWYHNYNVILTNLNFSFGANLIKCIKLFLKSILKHSLKLNLNSVKWDFKIFYTIIKSLPFLYNNRKEIIKGDKFLRF